MSDTDRMAVLHGAAAIAILSAYIALLPAAHDATRRALAGADVVLALVIFALVSMTRPSDVARFG